MKCNVGLPAEASACLQAFARQAQAGVMPCNLDEACVCLLQAGSQPIQGSCPAVAFGVGG